MYLVLLGALNQTPITICTAEELCWCLVTSFVTKHTVYAQFHMTFVVTSELHVRIILQLIIKMYVRQR